MMRVQTRASLNNIILKQIDSIYTCDGKHAITLKFDLALSVGFLNDIQLSLKNRSEKITMSACRFKKA